MDYISIDFKMFSFQNADIQKYEMTDLTATQHPTAGEDKVHDKR